MRAAARAFVAIVKDTVAYEALDSDGVDPVARANWDMFIDELSKEPSPGAAVGTLSLSSIFGHDGALRCRGTGGGNTSSKL